MRRPTACWSGKFRARRPRLARGRPRAAGRVLGGPHRPPEAIDASIAAKAEFEHLYDKPYEDKRTVRVAGPFTVESLSPHRMLGVDEHGELIDRWPRRRATTASRRMFAAIILDQLRTAGVQQAHKERPHQLRLADSLARRPRVRRGALSRRRRVGAATARRRLHRPRVRHRAAPGLVEAAREAAEAGFDLLIACAFNYEAHATSSTSWAASRSSRPA